MSIYVALDVGRAGKDITVLTAIERTGEKHVVIGSVDVPVMDSPMRQDVAFASATLRLRRMILEHVRATDD